MAADPREFQLRRERVSREMGERHLDALLVAYGPNLRYLTGFTGSNGLLLLTDGEPLFFTDPRYGIQASSEVNCAIHVCTGPLLNAATAAARRRRIRRLGFERALTTYETFRTLERQMPRAMLEALPDWIEVHRRVKSASEVEAIRRSVTVNSRAFEAAVSRARAGAKESDLAAEFEYRMRRLGAEKPAFETIVAAGERSALPHARPSESRLKPGDLVVVDMGAVVDGYASDMTRMLFVGLPGPRARRLYKAVLEAQLAALSAVRAGVTAAYVDRKARSVLNRFGYGAAFVHSTGHGLGLDIHEAPRIGRKETTRLAAGMVITVEPGAYLQGFGGVRIEDTVVVTGNGCEILTPTGKELIRIE